MLVCGVAPPKGKCYEWDHHRAEREISLKREDAGHEDLEYDDTPDEADKGNRPALTLGFVWLVKHYKSLGLD